MWILGLVGLLAGCGGGSSPEQAPEQAPRPALPDGAPQTVLLVSFDTFRWDAGGPNLSRLGSSGVRFDAAMAPAPSTLASHTSVFTGLYPHHHGVPRNEYRVHESLDTLPDRLRVAGYESAAFLGAMPLDVHTGLVSGFDRVDARFDIGREDGAEQVERDGAKVTDAALAWLEEQDGPAFAFVHYYDAHQPWTPGRFAPKRGPQQATMEELYAARRGEGNLTKIQLSLLYWADARQDDHELGRLLSGVAEMGRDDALVVVFGDHGEAFALHEERWDHGHRVYDETVRVPVVIAGPGVEPAVVTEPVSLVDLAPTLLGKVGLEPGETDGVDLGPLLEGKRLDRGPVFTEATKPFDPPESGWVNAKRYKKVRDGKWALHWDPVSNGRWLFDLEADPGELKDLAAAHPEQVERLAALLEGWAAEADPLPSKRVSDAETIEQLRSLGYLD